MQRRYYAAILILTVLFSGCYIGGERVHGDGNLVKKTRETGSFTRLEVRGSMNVLISRGDDRQAVIEADANLVPYVETVRDGDKLVVKFKNNVSVDTHDPVNVYLTTSDIESLSLLGSGDITSSDTLSNGNGLKLSLGGSGNMKLTAIVPEVNANIAGSGDIMLGGSTRNLDVNIAGSGDFHGEKLMSENARTNIAGSGNAYVNASVSLDAEIIGSGNVSYGGDAKVTSHVIGSGALVKQ